MKTYKISSDNIKNFMPKLLVNDNFDKFEVRQVEINSFANFSISSILTKDETNILYWSVLKPYVYNIIKGNALPKNIKIIFSLPKEEIETISSNFSACFLNFSYENGEALFITGSSTKTFSLNKSEEILFDEYIEAFFDFNKIPTEDIDD